MLASVAIAGLAFYVLYRTFQRISVADVVRHMREMPAHVLLPRPIGRTGVNLPHGHTAGYLGRQHDPFILNADPAVRPQHPETVA